MRKVFNKIAVGLKEALAIVKGEAKPARIHYVSSVTAEQARNLLMPALTMASTSEVIFDCMVERGSLIIKGYNKTTQSALGFALTPMAIADGRYLDIFKTSLPQLKKMLLEPQAASKYPLELQEERR